ncbi:hypothetical protein [Nitrosovibrio sp. Nv17]|uniref:hypothetical protein n=1 Tax=Nitrosovibrio sp. Nv17 TaxID=1855339 RepID=UPI0009089D4C|nr:hypothetical protein [Nitrosovibrio sp. Nv17]SFW40852.1 hypothetical protein SAMN05216414_1463 [Nitrosovibrio sp. Nv17]
MSSAYEIAKAGGKHSGWYKVYRVYGQRQIVKSIRNLEKQIAYHENWIANPLSKIQNYHDLDARERIGLITGWEADIRRQRELVGILQGILKERENE